MVGISRSEVFAPPKPSVGGGGGGYTAIQDEGSGLTARATLNFIGAAVVAADNAGATRTDVTINALPSTGGTYTGAVRFTGSGSQLDLEGTSPLTNSGYSFVLDQATTNLFPNPSLETNTTSFAAVGGTTFARANTAGYAVWGDYGGHVTKASAVANDGVETSIITGLTAGTTYTLSVYVKGLAAGQTLQIVAVDNATSPVTTIGQQFTAENNRYGRYSVTATIGAGGTGIRLRIVASAAIASMDFVFDGVQFEARAYPSSYCDGSIGPPGYAWTGTAHASSSTRAAGAYFLTPLTANTFTIGTDGMTSIGRGAEGSNSENGNGLIVNAYTQQASGEAMGIQIVSYIDGAASSATVAGLDSTAAVKSGNANNHSGPFYGTSGAVVHEGSGVISLAYGIVAGVFNGFKGRGGNGSITTAIGVEVYAPGTATGGTGTFTNARGVEIQAQSAGITENVGIYLHMSGLPNGQAAVTQAMGLYMPIESVAFGNTTGTITYAAGIYLGAPTYNSTTNVRTVILPASLIIDGNPVAGTSVSFSNGPWGLYLNNAFAYFTGPVSNQRDKFWVSQTDRQGAPSTTNISMSTYGHAGWLVASTTAVTIQTNARGSWSRLSTSATSGNTSTVLPTPTTAAYTHTRKDWIPLATMVVEIPTITSIRAHCGLYSGNPAAADSLATLSAYGFRFSTGAADANWQCITANGAAQTVADSTVAVAANTRYVLQIEVVDANTVRFWINYRLVATATATLPAAATDLGMALTVATLTTAQRDLHMNHLRLEQV